jgi:hypothetical protein
MKSALGWIALLAGLVLASPGPALGQAGGAMPAPAGKPTWTLTFRNELRIAVIVQTVTSVGVLTRRDKPVLLAAGATTTVPFDGHKIYTIYDARSNRVLVRSVLKYTGQHACRGIVLDPRVPGMVNVIPRPLPTPPSP